MKPETFQMVESEEVPVLLCKRIRVSKGFLGLWVAC